MLRRKYPRPKKVAPEPTNICRRSGRLKHLSHQTTRHGKKVWYFLVPGTKKRIRIRGIYGTRSFEEQHEAIMLSAEGHGVLANRIVAEKILQRRTKNARARDKRKKRVPDIDAEWAIALLKKQRYRCALTGIEFLSRSATSKNNPYSPSFDRIDNSKGYTSDNVRLVLFAVNAMLLDWGIGVFNHVVEEYRKKKSRLSPNSVDAITFNNIVKSGGYMRRGGPASFDKLSSVQQVSKKCEPKAPVETITGICTGLAPAKPDWEMDERSIPLHPVRRRARHLTGRKWHDLTIQKKRRNGANGAQISSSAETATALVAPAVLFCPHLASA